MVAIHEAYRLSRIHRIPHLEDVDHGEGWDAVVAGRVTIGETIEARRALERLAELPPRQRRDLALHVAGFSYREIAKVTGGRTYTNVNKHLRKARSPFEQVEAMRLACLRRDDLRSATLIILLAYAGPRPESEALPLTWAAIRRRTILIRDGAGPTAG